MPRKKPQPLDPRALRALEAMARANEEYERMVRAFHKMEKARARFKRYARLARDLAAAKEDA